MPVVNRPVTVIKRDPSGKEVWRYRAMLVDQEGSALHLEAPFNRADLPFMGITIKQDDRFVETYYTDRWYNVYEIRDRDTDMLKGWYCNIGKPAVFEAEDVISYVDLALDLWVAPDGTQTVLDEDEFAALELDAETRSRARAALDELQRKFAADERPGR
jgi:predicted RNA-binding protein associated with RNAse of E/G family